jgi:hypothetical protein
LTLGLTSGAAIAAGVIDSGFCLKKAGRDCAQRVPFQATISMGDLPTDEHGRRILHFYCRIDLERGEIVLQAWERSGENYPPAPAAKLFLSESNAERINGLYPDLESKIQGISIKLGHNLFVVPVISEVKSENYVAFSNRVVSSPGTYVAQMLDANGQPLQGSKVMEVNIVP